MPSGPFDAVVCWFTSFGYFDDDDNRKVLDEFAQVLRPGGRLLMGASRPSADKYCDGDTDDAE